MITGALILALILFQYIFTYIFLVGRNNAALLAVLVYSMASYDVIFIHASYFFPKIFVTVSKLYFEYLFIYLCVSLWRRHGPPNLYNPVTRRFVLLLVVPSLLSILLNDWRCDVVVIHLLTGLRQILLPILVLFLLHRYGALEGVAPTYILNTLIVFAVLFGISGIIQRLNFHGRVNDLWYYDFFQELPLNPVRVGQANYLRGGLLRTTGIFVSPITQSVSLSIGSICVFASLLYLKRSFLSYINLFIVLAFLLYCQLKTETRVGLVMSGLAFFILLAHRITKIKYAILYALPISAVLGTFALLLSGLMTEVSALGRLEQYQHLIRYFEWNGLGFAHPYSINHFDSYVITISFLYGFLVLLPVILIIKLNRSALSCLREAPRDPFFHATLAIAATFIYVYAFQLIAGSFPYRIYFLLLFFCWFTHERRLKSRAFAPDSGHSLQAEAR